MPLWVGEIVYGILHVASKTSFILGPNRRHGARPVEVTTLRLGRNRMAGVSRRAVVGGMGALTAGVAVTACAGQQPTAQQAATPTRQAATIEVMHNIADGHKYRGTWTALLS